MRAQKIVIVFFSLVLFFAYAIWRYDLRLPQPPSIILIEIDSLRPDHLGCYGYYRPTSPNIDALAAQATRYTNCYSTSTWTIPANYSLLTSLYPQQHTVVSPYRTLDPSISTIMSFLNKERYPIGIFNDHFYFFDHLNPRHLWPAITYSHHADAESVNRAAKQWLARCPRPFFLWTYFLGPHRPYAAPPPHQGLFPYADAPPMPLAKSALEYYDGWDSIPQSVAQNGIMNPEFYIARYDETIHYADAQVGELIRTLKEQNLFDNCLIIVFADHGESLGEHHLFFNHTWTLFNEIIKIPLIVKWPHITQPRVVHSPASILDIFPTIVRAMHKTPPSTTNGIPLQNTIDHRRQILCYNPGLGTCIIDAGWKLIKYTPRDPYALKTLHFFFPNHDRETYQLFDLTNDPAELIDRMRLNPDQAQHLIGQLKYLETPLKAHAFPIHKHPVPPDMQETLKSLGYTQ